MNARPIAASLLLLVGYLGCCVVLLLFGWRPEFAGGEIDRLQAAEVRYRLQAAEDKKYSRLSKCANQSTMLRVEARRRLEELNNSEAEHHMLQALNYLDQARTISASYCNEPGVFRNIPEWIRSDFPSDIQIIYYSNEGSTSYAWLLGEDAVEFYELGPTKTVALLSANVVRELSTGRRGFETQSDALRSLSDIILQPIAADLHAAKLVIVADGVMNRVPFAALPITQSNGNETLLVERFELSRLQSIGSFKTLRDRRLPRREPKRMVVFSDPIYSPLDPRLPVVSRDTGRGMGLSRLPGTAAESAEIAALFPKDHVTLLTGVNASRQHLLSLKDQRIDLLHVAAHSDASEQLGISLSRYSSTGAEVQGLVTAADIRSTDLSGGIVVLSGCSSLVGRRGEGLSRSFLEAGASGVVGTLWAITDLESSEFMAVFYEFLSNSRSVPQALRETQLSFLSNNPKRGFQWASYVFEGDPESRLN